MNMLRKGWLTCLLAASLTGMPQGVAADEKTRALQQALYNTGFDPNGIDGSLGPGTRRAFVAFWHAQGLDLSAIDLGPSVTSYFASVVRGFDPKRLKQLRAAKADDLCSDRILASAAALKPYGIQLSPADANTPTRGFVGKLKRNSSDGDGHPMIFLFDHSSDDCLLLGAWRGKDGAYLYENGSYVYPWRRTSDGKEMEVSAQLINSTVILKNDQGTHSFAVKGF